ncbi:DeoR/GlpR family DNA-binding transcription regulator [Vibrio aphrogenes]|uniref:DeoR/GlpR family DNA-binding transcription regulator n=1 Tax=Vibrio aphrogenes TaxID=1891186 RepID=UPI000B34BC15|nr:DeoR/GlpR family DNA-binding transcription regulator [Vibrio aphrogenes]
MKSVLRANYILRTLNKVGKISAIDLADDLQVSVETIRRDLKALDRRGEILRIHGGAVSKNYKDEGTSFIRRAGNCIDEKAELVEQALDNIFESAAIGLDASTSSWLLAQQLPDIHCTVVTNSLNIIQVLADKKNIITICLGGSYSDKYKAFYGMITKATLNNMSLDLAIISCEGFDKESGVWDSNEYNYDIKKKLIEISERTILIADKSKYKKRSLIKICNLDEIDIIISNANLAE